MVSSSFESVPGTPPAPFLDVELEGFNTKDLDLSLMEDECDCH